MKINLEKTYLNIICGTLTFIFFLWFFINYFKIPHYFFKVIIFLSSYIIWYFVLRKKEIKRTDGYLHHIVLIVLLLFTLVLWASPLFFNPDQPLGKGYTKPIHDGMSIYIARNGLPLLEEEGILNYVNGMHLTGAFFKFLFPLFHLNLAAILFGIIVNSLTVYLILLAIYRNKYIASIFAGVSGLVSFKLPLLYYLSPTMLFSLLLFLPCLYLFYLAHKQGKKAYYAAFGIAFGALTISYNGTSLVFFGIILILLLVKNIFLKKTDAIKKLGILFLIMLLFFLGGSLNQGELYWDNILNLNKERCDCIDTAHYTAPIVEPVFLLLFIPAFALFFIKKEFRGDIWLYIVVIIILLLSFVPYSIIFNRVNPMPDYQSCLKNLEGGLFSCMNHERVHRFAFLQDFVFLLVLPSLAMIFKKDKYKTAVALFLAIIILFLPFNLAIYEVGATQGSVNISDLKNEKRLTAPLFLLKSSRSWVEKDWSRQLSEELFYIYPYVNANRTLVYVVWDDEPSMAKRWLLYIFFDKNYKYVYQPKKFFQEYVFQYNYVINQPCNEDQVPQMYEKIRQNEDICVFKKK